MYRIIKEYREKGILYTVQKNRKWFIPWKWHDCKLEVFYGPGTIIYKASFATKEEAETYIKHKGTAVNALIQGYKFYQE